MAGPYFAFVAGHAAAMRKARNVTSVFQSGGVVGIAEPWNQWSAHAQYLVCAECSFLDEDRIVGKQHRPRAADYGAESLSRLQRNYLAPFRGWTLCEAVSAKCGILHMVTQ